MQANPAVLLPSQTVNRRRLAHMPEMRLVAVMFDDAVECIVRNVDARCGTRRREFLEARDWLWDDTRAWPFAFANVCDLLGLEAGAVRERLERIVPGQRRAIEEPHRHHATPATFRATGALNEPGFRPNKSRPAPRHWPRITTNPDVLLVGLARAVA
jgi:hypothetical protein